VSYYVRNGKKYYRMPDKNGRIRGKLSKLFLLFYVLAIFIDMLAMIAVHLDAPHILNTLQVLLSPIDLIFDAIQIPITGGYFSGPNPGYYRLLLLSSAFLGISWGTLLTWHFCKRYRFLRNPSYYAMAVQRSYLRHRLVYTSNYWFYFIRLRIMNVVLTFFCVVMFFIMFSGQTAFHVNDLVMPIFFSLFFLPILWFLLPWFTLALVSCACSDLRTIKKVLAR